MSERLVNLEGEIHCVDAGEVAASVLRQASRDLGRHLRRLGFGCNVRSFRERLAALSNPLDVAPIPFPVPPGPAPEPELEPEPEPEPHTFAEVIASQREREQ